MASTTDVALPDADGEVSPRQKSPPNPTIPSLGSISNGALGSLDMRADPDAQATVTDFLDFTEYLHADMFRSLTLIGNLDKKYDDASLNVHELTTKWGQLPSLPADQRPNPTRLRADISENLNHAVDARIYSHAEAVRMAENINRHYVRANTILTKLQTMLDNYPSAEELEKRSPVATVKSPQLSRAQKPTPRGDGPRIRRPNVPRITVPGEVLAPYDLNYDTYSDDDVSSSELDEDDDDELDSQSARVTPGPQPRIKVVKKGSKSSKNPKTPKSRTSVPPPLLAPGLSTSSALAQLQPPPENAVIGSADAPWGQLTQWELARLRKRMKKNAAWAPSDTMIARELKNLGRGVEAYNAAKQKAEEEGKPFDGMLPAPIVDPDTGAETLPPGALSKDTLAAEEQNLSNRGMKLNEAKKLKREQLAKLAAEEAEESARKMVEAARAMFDAANPQGGKQQQDQANKTPSKAPKPPKKRKRDSIPEAEAEVDKTELIERSQKRTKTETPVPPPQVAAGTSTGTSQSTQQSQESSSQQSQPQPQPQPQPQLQQPPQPESQPAQTPQQQRPVAPPATAIPLSTTPIPLPVHGQDQATARMATSPGPSASAGTVTTSVPLKPPAETPIPLPPHSPKKSTTPILPPTRETRKTQATRKDQQKETTQPQQLTVKPSSRATTPSPLTPKPDPDAQSSGATGNGTSASAAASNRRPVSRGKASSQEPPSSLAADRPRRASTARNTPAPERGEQPAQRPASKRAKRPAPGVISRTNSGGSSAVTKRKAAPKKKSAKAAKKDKSGGSADAGGSEMLEVEVDDEGNVIDPDEPRYCLCNRVSYGTMIQCDNLDNCKHEWFHLECVGLQEIPARTTKWYCPDCRILLNIGEKGEVNSRGVRA